MNVYAWVDLYVHVCVNVYVYPPHMWVLLINQGDSVLMINPCK